MSIILGGLHLVPGTPELVTSSFQIRLRISCGSHVPVLLNLSWGIRRRWRRWWRLNTDKLRGTVPSIGLFTFLCATKLHNSIALMLKKVLPLFRSIMFVGNCNLFAITTRLEVGGVDILSPPFALAVTCRNLVYTASVTVLQPRPSSGLHLNKRNSL